MSCPRSPTFRPSSTRPRTPSGAGPFLQLQKFPASILSRLSPDFFVFALLPPFDPKRPFFLIAGPATNLLQLQNFPAARFHDIFICQNILPESNFHAPAVALPGPPPTPFVSTLQAAENRCLADLHARSQGSPLTPRRAQVDIASNGPHRY